MRGEALAARDDGIADWFESRGESGIYTGSDGSMRPITVIFTKQFKESSPLGYAAFNEDHVAFVRLSELPQAETDCWVTLTTEPEARKILSVEPAATLGYVKLTLSEL